MIPIAKTIDHFILLYNNDETQYNSSSSNSCSNSSSSSSKYILKTIKIYRYNIIIIIIPQY